MQLAYNEAVQNSADVLFFETKYVIDNFIDKITHASSSYEISPVDIYKDNLTEEDLTKVEQYFIAPALSTWNKLIKLKLLKDNDIKFNENLVLIDDFEFYTKYIFIPNVKVYKSKNIYYCHTKLNRSSLTNIKRDKTFLKEAYIIKYVIENFKRQKKIFRMNLKPT